MNENETNASNTESSNSHENSRSDCACGKPADWQLTAGENETTHCASCLTTALAQIPRGTLFKIAGLGT